MALQTGPNLGRSIDDRGLFVRPSVASDALCLRHWPDVVKRLLRKEKLSLKESPTQHSKDHQATVRQHQKAAKINFPDNRFEVCLKAVAEHDLQQSARYSAAQKRRPELYAATSTPRNIPQHA
jgi:hypothetical protein